MKKKFKIFILKILKYLTFFKPAILEKLILLEQNNDITKTSISRYFNDIFFCYSSDRVMNILDRFEKNKKMIFDTHLFAERPKMYIDVGANIGYWSFSRFKCLNEVEEFFCFEPATINFKLLMKNFAKKKKFKLIKAAISDANSLGIISFPKSETRKNNLGLLSLHGDSNFLKEEIELMTLDKYFKDYFNDKKKIYLKIDTEGNESRVLLGAEKFLQSNNQIVLEVELNTSLKLSISNKENIEQSLKILELYKYVPFIYNGKFIEITYQDIYLNKLKELNYFFKKN